MKTKRVVAVLMVVCLLLCMIPPVQTNAATEGNYTYSVSYGSATITKCSTSISGDITIPATLGGYPVTRIGDKAFYNCKNLTSVIVPDSVTRIGKNAFYSCTSLVAVVIGENVNYIEDNAFRYCENLISVEIPASVTFIGTDVFAYCDNLISVMIPSSVTSIGYKAFSPCESLEGIWVSANNLNYSSDDRGVLFNKEKTELIQAPGGISDDYTIVDGVVSINNGAFYSCNKLNSVTIPDSVTSIGDGVFTGCTNLVYHTFDNARYLGNEKNPYIALISAISTEITSCWIHEDTKLICGSAFYYRESLQDITIPDDVIAIGDYAFSYCSSLNSVTLGNGVTNVGSWAFSNCVNLTSVKLGDSVCSLSLGMFNGCKKLAAVIIPDSVTTIESSAFYDCDMLSSVTIPNGVTSIGFSAFYKCDNLSWVAISDSIISIGASTFEGCTNLSSVIIPSSVTSIGGSAFCSCHSLTSVTYCGTPEQWGNISIGSFNTQLTNADRQYHDYQEATCTMPEICSICGMTGSEALGHGGNWQQIIEPSCTDGLEACICDICGETVTRTVPATHSYESVVTAPTCTTDGYTTHTCSTCGDIYVDSYVSGGHNYESIVTEPTCTEQGYTTYTCTACGDSRVEDYVAATGHNYETVVTAPTCTTDGYTTHTCTVCGDSYVDSYMEATGHSWSAWIQLAAPTCAAEGSQLRFCNCGAQETETIAKLEHTYENNVCTACGDVICTEHSFENGICTGCEQTLAEAVDLDGDGKVSAFDAQFLAEAKAGLRTLTDEQWLALGTLKVSDIIDYILGRFPGMATEE